jgi:hypothetical protein
MVDRVQWPGIAPARDAKRRPLDDSNANERGDEMKKIVFASVLSALSIIAVLGLGFLMAPRVSAQRAQDNNTKERWEYCAIVDSYGTSDGNKATSDGNKAVVGYAKIVNFEHSGDREQTVKVDGGTAGDGEWGSYERARQKALGAAIAQLGNQGWEMAGEADFGIRIGSEEKKRALYFKRSKGR